MRKREWLINRKYLHKMQNKCFSVLIGLAALVAMGICDKAVLSFLVVGQDPVPINLAGTEFIFNYYKSCHLIIDHQVRTSFLFLFNVKVFQMSMMSAL